MLEKIYRKCTTINRITFAVVKAIVFITKPRFNLERMYCVNTKVAGEDNSLRVNLQ